jgi:hypothetical protein
MEYCQNVSPDRSFCWQVTLTAFCDVNGVVNSESMATGATINSERLSGTLQKLKERIRRVRLEQVFLQHDNARPQTSARKDCRDSPSWTTHHAAQILLRFPSLPETEGTSERTSIFVRQ